MKSPDVKFPAEARPRAACACLAALLSLCGGTAPAAQRPAPAAGQVRLRRVNSQSPETRPALSGVVRDVNRAAVAGARVRLVKEGGGARLTAATDDEGRFRLAGVGPGTYTLAVESPGFRSFKRKGLKLAAGADVALDVTLSAEEPPGLVPASARPAPGPGSC